MIAALVVISMSAGIAWIWVCGAQYRPFKDALLGLIPVAFAVGLAVAMAVTRR